MRQIDEVDRYQRPRKAKQREATRRNAGPCNVGPCNAERNQARENIARASKGLAASRVAAAPFVRAARARGVCCNFGTAGAVLCSREVVFQISAAARQVMCLFVWVPVPCINPPLPRAPCFRAPTSHHETGGRHQGGYGPGQRMIRHQLGGSGGGYHGGQSQVRFLRLWSWVEKRDDAFQAYHVRVRALTGRGCGGRWRAGASLDDLSGENVGLGC